MLQLTHNIKGDMEMRKLCITNFLLIFLFTFLTGCSNQTSAITNMDDYATNEGYESVTTSNKGIPKEQIKIGILLISDSTITAGYTYTHDLGIQGMQNNLGLSDEQIVYKWNVPDTNQAAIKNALQECIDEGCNIIFATSFGYMETMAEMAEQYPDIYFSHASGHMSNGKNFNNYFGRIYQARYLSGIAAGLKTQSNKLGYVAAQGSDSSEVTGGIDAFAMGAYSVNPNAKIYVKVTGSWDDPEAEKAATHFLIDYGCDVIAQHCDSAFPQILAQEAGVWGIGYNSDMSKEAPNATLTSVLWNWSAYYTHAVQSIIDGTWDGENYLGGINEGLVSLSPLTDFNAPNANEKINEAQKSMVEGTFNVFDGEIETNTGEIIGKPNSTLDDTTILRGINWYFKNVVILQ